MCGTGVEERSLELLMQHIGHLGTDRVGAGRSSGHI